MDEKQMVPIRIFNLLFRNVLSDALEYLPGIFRHPGAEAGRDTSVDFKVPWQWAYHGTLFHPGAAQFAFGFYSIMLTSTVLGLITMILFKPRSWCVYCPMGTMTQIICKVKNREKNA